MRTNQGYCRVQWAETPKGGQRRWLADGGRKDEENKDKKRRYVGVGYRY